MSAICDRMLCGQAATHRLTSRPYCARHAAEIAQAVNGRVGRPIVRLLPLGATGAATAGVFGA